MRAEAKSETPRFSPRTLRQVGLDSGRALARSNFCVEASQIDNLRCVDHHAETEHRFGSQLWYFEGTGVDEVGHRQSIYGVVEYSVQFGLQELIEDAVFDAGSERERFRHVYDREVNTPSWRQPAHRLLIAAMIAVAAATLVVLLMRSLLA